MEKGKRRHGTENRPLSPLHRKENVASRDNSIITEHIDSCTLHEAGSKKRIWIGR